MANPLQEAIAAIRRTPLLTGLSALMVGLALFVVGLFGLAAHNLRMALEEVEERVEVVAYLPTTTRRKRPGNVPSATCRRSGRNPPTWSRIPFRHLWR
jgi:cell division protein FtsX